MKRESQVELISRISDEIWNEGRLEVIEEVMAADARYHGPHMPGGMGSRGDWREHIARIRRAFPDSHVEYQEFIESGKTVIARWRATGTHTGDLGPLQPTGRQVAIGGITIYRISEGSVAEAWEQLDMLGMWQQLGVVPLPGPSEP